MPRRRGQSWWTTHSRGFSRRGLLYTFHASREKCHTIMIMPALKNLFDVSRSECYKTVLILETPFWVAGAAESMEIGKFVIGASNKSGRRCKRSDELQLIYLMHLDLSGTKRCSFWSHRFG